MIASGAMPNRSLSASKGTIGVYGSSSSMSERISEVISMRRIIASLPRRAWSGHAIIRRVMSTPEAPAAQRPGISAFFPASNDGGTIGSVVVATLATLESVTDDYEVIVVENGSTDYTPQDRKSTRLNSSHANISYAVFCLKKKKTLLFTQHIHAAT